MVSVKSSSGPLSGIKVSRFGCGVLSLEQGLPGRSPVNELSRAGAAPRSRQCDRRESSVCTEHSGTGDSDGPWPSTATSGWREDAESPDLWLRGHDERWRLARIHARLASSSTARARSSP